MGHLTLLFHDKFVFCLLRFVFLIFLSKKYIYIFLIEEGRIDILKLVKVQNIRIGS